MYLTSQTPLRTPLPACAGPITLRRSTHSVSGRHGDAARDLRAFPDLARAASSLPLGWLERRAFKEAVMTRWIAVIIAALSIVSTGRAYAQETVPGPGTLEVTIIPGGGTFYTSGGKGPSSGSYNLGGALTYNVNRIVGIEGEVGGTLGIAQDLQFGGLNTNQKGPNQLSYSGNLVGSAPTRAWIVP